MANMYVMTPGYLKAMQTRLIAGRDLDARDTKDSPDVALVNEAFAAQLLPGEDAVGKRFRYGPTGKWVQIAGIVEDGKYRSLGETPSPTVFQDMEQNWRSNTTLVARSPLAESETTRLLRRAVAELDPTLTIYESGSLTSQLALALFPAKLVAVVLASFGLLAVVLAATGVCTLAQIVPMGLARARPARPGEHAAAASEARPERSARRPGMRVMLPLLAFTGLYVFVYAGEPIKYGYLTIYMHNDLHLPTAVSGAVIGIQPLIELILMPVAVVVARRIGMMRLMVLGAAFGVGANLCFALTGTAVGMFAGQILMGGVWGVFAALGIIVAQRLLPQAVATASAVFMSSTAIASALGGLTGSVGVAVLGLPHVFLAPALYGVIATVGITAMSRSRHSVS